jgi:hypothetical protein
VPPWMVRRKGARPQPPYRDAGRGVCSGSIYCLIVLPYLCSREHAESTNAAVFVLPGAQILLNSGLCSREHKYCLLVLPGAQMSLDCAPTFMLPGAQILLDCASGSTNTAGRCSREQKYCLFVLPGAQILLVCAPGSTDAVQLCSREHKYCLFVLPGAQMLLDCAPGSTNIA